MSGGARRVRPSRGGPPTRARSATGAGRGGADAPGLGRARSGQHRPVARRSRRRRRPRSSRYRPRRDLVLDALERRRAPESGDSRPDGRACARPAVSCSPRTSASVRLVPLPHVNPGSTERKSTRSMPEFGWLAWRARGGTGRARFRGHEQLLARRVAPYDQCPGRASVPGLLRFRRRRPRGAASRRRSVRTRRASNWPMARPRANQTGETLMLRRTGGGPRDPAHGHAAVRLRLRAGARLVCRRGRQRGRPRLPSRPGGPGARLRQRPPGGGRGGRRQRRGDHGHTLARPALADVGAGVRSAGGDEPRRGRDGIDVGGFDYAAATQEGVDGSRAAAAGALRGVPQRRRGAAGRGLVCRRGRLQCPAPGRPAHPADTFSYTLAATATASIGTGRLRGGRGARGAVPGLHPDHRPGQCRSRAPRQVALL